MSNIIKPIILSSVILLLIVCLTIGTALYSREPSCNAKWDLMKKKVNYSFFTGCMVEYKLGEYIPINQYRVVD